MCCKKNCMCKRFCLALLSSVGFTIIFGMRGNVGYAGPVMVTNRTNEEPGINWTPATVGIIEASFFWGYLITQVPGGFLAASYPANRVFGIAIVVSSLLNQLMPVAAKLHSTAFICLRLLQGMAEGVTIPAIYGVWRHWAPPMERSILTTISFFGVLAAQPVGYIISILTVLHIGWEASFYIYGSFGLIWSFFWLWVSSEKPATHTSISLEERTYIEKAIGKVSTSTPTFRTTPWKSIFTSMPVYAILVAHFCYSWTFYTLLSIPYYFYVLDKTYQGWFRDGKPLIYSVATYLLMPIMVPIGGLLADRFRRCFSTTTVRKIFNCGGFGLGAAFLLAMGFTHHGLGEMLLIAGAEVSSSFAFSGFHVNHLDIAPRYASILMGISNAFGTLSGMICPIVMESILDRGTHVDQWKVVFIIAGCIHLGGVLFYALFASGEKQPWAEPPLEDEGASYHPLSDVTDGQCGQPRHSSQVRTSSSDSCQPSYKSVTATNSIHQQPDEQPV